jgi:hypothetical protein
MSRWISVFIIFVAIFAQATNDYRSIMAAETLCSDSWYRFIEETVLTSDTQGHGPDVGSGLRPKPQRDNPDRCRDNLPREELSKKLGVSQPSVSISVKLAED